MNFFDRTNTLGAYLITPAIGSNFVMYSKNARFDCRIVLEINFFDFKFWYGSYSFDASCGIWWLFSLRDKRFKMLDWFIL